MPKLFLSLGTRIIYDGVRKEKPGATGRRFFWFEKFSSERSTGLASAWLSVLAALAMAGPEARPTYYF
jgi:hypothetical protein